MDIQTVTGPLAPTAILGPVLPHEHLAIDLRTPNDQAGVLAHPEAVAEELKQARQQYGLSLVVDQTARGMGRDVDALVEISTTSGVPVVASTGWYYQKFHPMNEPGYDVGFATDILIADLTSGIPTSSGTRVLPGVIGEVGTHAMTPSPAERVSLLAAARAAIATGRPISTHAHLGTGARAQVELLAGAGVDLSRVSIGHQDLIADSEQHQFIAQSGAYVAFDTVGKESYQTDPVRLQLVCSLIAAGYERSILLSNDISRYGYLQSEGGFGYQQVLGPFAAQLKASGVTEETLDLLYRRNAVRWLTGVDLP